MVNHSHSYALKGLVLGLCRAFSKSCPCTSMSHDSARAGLKPTNACCDRFGVLDAEQPRNLVGTLVNGAGLAMNTNDVLHTRLSQPPYHTTSANFLDTGGKATSSTIKTSFKLILSDPRVSVVFVNIFGGLTLGDMIAEGIIMAFKEVGVDKPVVVRIRGTNEEEGRKVLMAANLPIHAFDDFEEAVKKVGDLADVSSRPSLLPFDFVPRYHNLNFCLLA